MFLHGLCSDTGGNRMNLLVGDTHVSEDVSLRWEVQWVGDGYVPKSLLACTLYASSRTAPTLDDWCVRGLTQRNNFQVNACAIVTTQLVDLSRL